jgi:hypothetical protein
MSISQSTTLTEQRRILFQSIFLGGTLKKIVDSEAIPIHSSVPIDAVSHSQWLHRVEQRLKQVEMGKNSIGYTRYRSKVPRQARRAVDPKTPKVADDKISKKVFDETMKAWRRQLHVFSIGEGSIQEVTCLQSGDIITTKRYIAPDLVSSDYDIQDSLYPQQQQEQKQDKQSNIKMDDIPPGTLIERKTERITSVQGFADDDSSLDRVNKQTQKEDNDLHYQKRHRSKSTEDVDKEYIDGIDKRVCIKDLSCTDTDEFTVDYGYYSEDIKMRGFEKVSDDENDYDYEADGYLDVLDCCNSSFGISHTIDAFGGIDRFGIRKLASNLVQDIIVSLEKTQSTIKMIDLAVGSFICPPLVGSLPFDENMSKQIKFLQDQRLVAQKR